MAKIKEESLRLNIIINGDAARKALLDQEAVVRKNETAVNNLKNKLKELTEAGRTSGNGITYITRELPKYEKELEESTRALEKMRRAQSINTMTMGELQRHAKLTRAALNSAVPGTENFDKLEKELKQCNDRMLQLRNNTRATGREVNKWAQNTANLSIVIGTALSVGRQAMTLVNQTTDKFIEQDEAMTDVMKTTGLTKEEVRELNGELKQLDTRTAQNELLSLARIGGKLGVQGQDQLLAFVRATDKINVALSEDLGENAEAAIATVGKLVDIFQLESKYGLEDSLLKVGSAINELGMASTANEGYIADLTSRLAGIAPNADISIAKILGLGATLDKYGQQAETSGTAIGQTIMAMFKRTETFANIAKMPLQEFADLLNKDVNEALLRVLEGMNDGGGLASVVAAMDEMHLNGQRAATVLGTLSKNTAELRAQQELASDAFEKGTSLQEEFNTKNTSAMALAEKRKKAIEEQVVAIGEQLLPVASGALELARVGLTLISGLISTMVKYKGAIIAVTTIYAAYAAAKRINNALSSVSRARIKEERLEIAREVTTLRHAKTSTIALSAAKNLLVGNLKAARVAFKMFTTSVKAGLGPIGWIALAVEGLIGAFALFSSKSKDQAEVAEEVSKSNDHINKSFSETLLQINKEQTRLNTLKEAVLSAAEGSKERAEAINRINTEYRDYLPALIDEKASNEDIATAIRDTNLELEKKIKLQAKEKALSKIYEDLDSKTVEALNTLPFLKDEAAKEQLINDIIKYRNDILNGVISGESDFINPAINPGYHFSPELNTSLDTAYPSQAEYYMGGYAEMNPDVSTVKGIVGSIASAARDAQEQLMLLNKLYSDSPDSNGTKPTNSNNNSGGDNPSTPSTPDPKDLERLIEESKKIIQSGNKDLITLENDRYNDQKKKFEDQKDALLAAGVDYNRLMETLDSQHQTRLSQIELKGIEDRIKLAEQEYQLKRARMENQHAEELYLAKQNGRDVEALKKEQAAELAALDMDYAVELQKILEDVTNIDGDISINLEGLSLEELNQLKQKLEEIRNLRNELDGTTSASSGEGGDSTTSTGAENTDRGGTMLGLNVDQWNALFDAQTNGWDRAAMAAQAFGNIANQALNIVAMAMQRQTQLERQQLQEYRDANNKKRQMLEQRLNSGLMTQEQYNREVEAMEAEQAAFEEELALKAAKRQKALQLVQAIINTAVGVTMALGSMMPPFNFINAGLVAALGAAEIAIIASTPVTSGAEEGGKIFTTREQDGKQFPARLSPRKRGLVSEPTILVGEAGPEYVIPNEGMQNPTLAPILATIEQARRSGTLKSLDFGAVYSPTVVAPGFAAGGRTDTQTTATGEDIITIDTASMTELLKLLKGISDKMDMPIPAVVSLLGPNGLIKALKDYQRMTKKGEA